MKIPIYKLFVVFKPTEHSEMADVFDGEAMSIDDIGRQYKGGLQDGRIHAIFDDKREAEKEAKKVLTEKARKTLKKYGESKKLPKRLKRL